MDPTLTSETSQQRASGTTAMARVGSVFEAVPDLAIYRPRWLQRCQHYQLLRSYYEGTVYNNAELRKVLKLYSGIRQIFGPLRRAVRVDVAKVPGGWALPADAPPALAAAVAQVREWSSARATYSRAVLHGAVAGEFGLLVIDDQVGRTVRIVALRADEVLTGTLSDGQPFGLVIKPGLVDRQGLHEWAQLITPGTIRIYRSGVLQEERANLQGRVPLLLSPYLAGESGVGENAFAGAQELLDRVNDAASQALDVVQRNAEPIIVISGADSVEMSAEHNALTLAQPDAKAYTLTPNLAVADALALIDKVLTEFKSVLPQLVLDALMSRNDLAYDTVLTLLGELIDHVGDVRTHVDAAVETAERWALEAASQMGILAGVDPALHRLDAERPVIQPTPAQQLALQQQRIAVESAQRLLDSPQEGAV